MGKLNELQVSSLIWQHPKGPIRHTCTQPEQVIQITVPIESPFTGHLRPGPFDLPF